jgi:hypothetical protein
MLRLVIAFCVLLALGSSANAEKRVALVIGNAAYTHAPELANPRNDARAAGHGECNQDQHPISRRVPH